MMRRTRRGMTLMEVMLAMSILVVMSMIGWSSLEGAIELNDALSLRDETQRTARVAMSRMRRELQLAYLSPNRTNNNPNPTFQTVFVGEDGDPDRLWFASLSHQRLYRNARESDQGEISLWVERADRDQGPGDVLYHRETGRIDELPDEGGRIWPLAYHVETFNLRYLDGRTNEWTDSWDSRSADHPYILPRAVQIGLVLLAPDPDDEDRSVEVPFLTTVLLDYADPLTPFGGNPLNQVPPEEDPL